MHVANHPFRQTDKRQKMILNYTVTLSFFLHTRKQVSTKRNYLMQREIACSETMFQNNH